ncbi:killer cell lectin-like receptor subfamily G member 1 isoform X2 [Rhineura floridana]|uniref:killer cell lectin-like receptor subfamily G member 1 isoform X2 n=1 Tax=Rhineura floridana TaxID=261503 RepID=UPI002AC8027D|nr:killer cell lectin-like receptor subfamily G member 1 isoform X2 [Rhineura floridana]
MARRRVFVCGRFPALRVSAAFEPLRFPPVAGRYCVATADESGEMSRRDEVVTETLNLETPEETEASDKCCLTRSRLNCGRTEPGSDSNNRRKIFLPIFVLSLIAIIVTVQVWKSNQTCPAVSVPFPLGPACAAGWIGYERKCYFFSEEERNWTSGQNFCLSHGSSLAVIESELEKVFLLWFSGRAYHWIGLRKAPNETWIWADGTEFKKTLRQFILLVESSGIAFSWTAPHQMARLQYLLLHESHFLNKK